MVTKRPAKNNTDSIGHAAKFSGNMDIGACGRRDGSLAPQLGPNIVHLFPVTGFSARVVEYGLRKTAGRSVSVKPQSTKIRTQATL